MKFGIIFIFIFIFPLVLSADFYCSNCFECNSQINSSGEGDRIFLNSSIEISSGTCINITNHSNLKFDCQGNTINGTDSSIIDRTAFLIQSSDNIELKNCSIENFYHGVYVMNSNYTKIQDNVIQKNRYGLVIYNSIYGSFYSNFILENLELDVDFNPSSSLYCMNGFVNNIGSGGREIEFYNSQVVLNNREYSGLILCNADNSVLNNIFISGSNILKNNEFVVFFSNNVSINNLVFENNNNFYAIFSNNLFLNNSVISGNAMYGIDSFYSAGWKILNSIFQFNSWGDLRISGVSNFEVHNNIFNSSHGVNNQYSNSLDFDNNYWSDTNGSGFSDVCIDSNFDGFCDSPYIGEVIDYFPLSPYYFIEECFSYWNCSSYSSCGGDNVSQCLSVIDMNNCGNVFSGLLSDYDLSCVYKDPEPEDPEPEENNSGDDSSSGGSSDSSGSSSLSLRKGYATPPPLPLNYVRHFFEFVSSDLGIFSDVDFEGISLKWYGINVNKDLRGVSIIIKNMEEFDPSFSNISNVISFFEFDIYNLYNSDINNATLRFEIDSKYDNRYIYLYRYSSDELTYYNATKISQNNSFSLYESVIPGFSYFAIVYGNEKPIDVSGKNIRLGDPIYSTDNYPDDLNNKSFLYYFLIWSVLFISFFILFLIELSRIRRNRVSSFEEKYFWQNRRD